ncbi:MAG: response regulator [Pseudomonadota bacterium]
MVSDGLDLLQPIKQQLPQTMVPMVTANNDAETVKTAMNRGAAGFIIKSFNASICS